MSAHGFRVAEDGHVVPLLVPVSGTANTDIFSMANHHHASIIISLGATMTAALTVTLKRSDDFASGNTTAIDFKYYQATGGVDTFGAVQSSNSSLVITSQPNSIYVIEIDSHQMSEDAKNLTLTMSSVATVVSVIGILSGARSAEEQSPTVLS